MRYSTDFSKKIKLLETANGELKKK